MRKVILTLSLALTSALATSACGSSGDSRPAFDSSQSGTEATEDENGIPGGGGGVPAPQPDRVGCAGGKYAETLPTSDSLSDLPFSASKAGDYMASALGRRFPEGKLIVEGGLASPMSKQQGSCVDRFLQDRSSAKAVLQQATTVVHECGHFYDLGQGSAGKSAYVMTSSLTLKCGAGDTTKRGGKTFARSLLKGDGYYESRPACNGQPKMGCDTYADIYLNGSDANAGFESGDQGFNMLLEEAAQYVNSLASALAFKESFQGQKSSQRDGILTFLWYVERYLKMAREEHPDAYAAISEDPCWRQAILTVWDRGWFYLAATRGEQNLGLDDAALEPLVKDKALVGEIDALRKLECQ